MFVEIGAAAFARPARALRTLHAHKLFSVLEVFQAKIRIVSALHDAQYQ